MDDHVRVSEIKIELSRLKMEQDDILDKYLGEDEGQFHKIGYWTCSQSPVGFCVYKPVIDKALDDCIYCHHPHDRY